MLPLPENVTIGKNSVGLRYFDVTHESCTARIFEQGAQLVAFQAALQPPMFWVSDAEPYEAGAAIRGGIPVCWPWFGPHPAGLGPAHGLVRNAPWSLFLAEQVDAGVRLGFCIELVGPPYAGLRAELVFELGAQLKLELTTINTSGSAQVVSCALHSYFPVGDVRQVQLYGAAGRRYADALKPEQSVCLETKDSLRVDRELDRIYYGSAPWEIHSPALNLRIDCQGSSSTVVWNPWVEKSARLSHFNPTDYLSMLCVETANCGADSLSLAPGQRHVTAVEYRYLPLEKSR